MKTRNKILGVGLLALLGLAPMKKAIAQDKEVTGNFSTGIVSHYIPPMGYRLGKGPHQQNYAGVNFKGFTVFNWFDYDIGAKEMNEIDLVAQYSKQFNDNTSATAKAIYWHYPGGDDDKAISLNVSNSKGLNKSLSAIWILKDKEIENGLSITGNVSKTFEHERGFSTTAGVNATYLENFYFDTGLANVTPYLNINYNKGNFNLTGFLNHQFGFIKEPEMLPPIDNLIWGGVSASVDF